MKTLEFLGGKYQQGEQILPGAIQTFRANQTATGRAVFVHRVPADDPAQQSAVLRLVSAALLHSAPARKMVLDVCDEEGCWYVVTETGPQCLLLREWLKLELDRATAQADGVVAQEAVVQEALEDTADREEEPRETEVSADVPAVTPEAPKAQPAATPTPAPEPAPREPGEFTRFFQGGAAPKPQSPPAPVQRSEPSPLAGVPAQRASSEAGPGEFTRQFLAASSTPTQPMPPEARTESAAKPVAAAAPVSPPKNEPGEFTRMFNAQAPSKPAQSELSRGAERPSNPDLQRGQDRFSKTGFVQRPSTPLPGEFTRLFSQPPGGSETEASPAYSAPAPRSEPDFGSRNSGSNDPFWSTPGNSNVDPLASTEPGEYTRMFGGGGNPQSVEPRFTAPAPSAPPRTFDDPLNATTPLMPAVTTPPVPKGPSEWTRIMQSNRPPENAATNAPQPSAAGSAPPAAGAPPPAMPPLKVNVPPPPNPMQAMHMPAPGGAGAAPPHVAMPAIPAPPAVKAPAIPAVPAIAIGNPNKKLLILLAVLVVLALLLVVLVVLTLKK